ncbi:hypothetical protein MTO96_026823, partial [Rhipicephalus appendiculatus]
AQKVGIINEYHNFIATTLDLHTVDLSDFQNSGTNLSGFVLVKKELWEHDIAAMRDAYSRTGFHPMFHGQRASRKPIRTDAALTQDALDLLVRAVQRLAAERMLARPPSVRCPGQQASPRHRQQSQAFVDVVKQTRISGLTGDHSHGFDGTPAQPLFASGPYETSRAGVGWNVECLHRSHNDPDGKDVSARNLECAEKQNLQDYYDIECALHYGQGAITKAGRQ